MIAGTLACHCGLPYNVWYAAIIHVYRMLRAICRHLLLCVSVSHAHLPVSDLIFSHTLSCLTLSLLAILLGSSSSAAELFHSHKQFLMIHL